MKRHMDIHVVFPYSFIVWDINMIFGLFLRYDEIQFKFVFHFNGV